MKKSVTVIIIVAPLILLLSIFIYLTYFKADDIGLETPTEDLVDEQLPDDDIEQEEDNFEFSADYIGDNTWEYSITGTLPTPCYEYETEEVVMESYPEQVVITMNIEQSGDVCIQVIQEVEESGSFSASEEAQVSFVVNQ
jgi:flagellar basal body-associated protein FliL